MPDQPPAPPPGPDDQPTEITAADDAATQQQAAVSAPAAAVPNQSWASKPLQVTRAVATGTAAGILLVGGVAGLAIGATLASDDSDDHGPARTGWHLHRGDLPERGEGDWREQGPPPGFEQNGPDDYFGPDGPESNEQTPEGDEPAPTEPSDNGT